jgi:hypothetical protein
VVKKAIGLTCSHEPSSRSPLPARYVSHPIRNKMGRITRSRVRADEITRGDETTHGSNHRGDSTTKRSAPRPSGMSCVSCRRLRARCPPTTDSEPCQRCTRLGKECMFESRGKHNAAADSEQPFQEPAESETLASRLRDDSAAAESFTDTASTEVHHSRELGPSLSSPSLAADRSFDEGVSQSPLSKSDEVSDVETHVNHAPAPSPEATVGWAPEPTPDSTSHDGAESPALTDPNSVDVRHPRYSTRTTCHLFQPPDRTQ